MHRFGHWPFVTSSIFIFALLVAMKGPAFGTSADAQPDQRPERITVVSNARLRAAPQITAEEITRLPLGTIVLVLDQSVAKEVVNEMEDFWHLVRTDDDKSGWIFGGLTRPFSTTGREEIYRQIAEERLQTARQDFFEQVDFYKFLVRAMAEVSTPAMMGELELAQLITLNKSLIAIPQARKPREPREPYASWVQLHKAQIVYSEFDGTWFVQLDRFWELEKKYHGSPIGERIAWMATQQPLSADCEGSVPCYFNIISMRDEPYLKLYPNGTHAGDIISKIDKFIRAITSDTQFVQQQMHFELRPEDRDQLKKEIAEFRNVLMRTSRPEKSALMETLDRLLRLIP